MLYNFKDSYKYNTGSTVEIALSPIDSPHPVPDRLIEMVECTLHSMLMGSEEIMEPSSSLYLSARAAG